MNGENRSSSDLLQHVSVNGMKKDGLTNIGRGGGGSNP